MKSFVAAVPDAWNAPVYAKSRYELQLTPSTMLVESCHYAPSGGRTRERLDFTAVLVELETGALLAETEFTGKAPSACPDSVPAGTTGAIYGKPAAEAFSAWLTETAAKLVDLPVLLVDMGTAFVTVTDRSPDGRYILGFVAESFAKPVLVWDAQTGAVMTRFAEHTKRINSAVFSSDGRYVVSAGDDAMVYVWEAQTGTVRAEVALPSAGRAQYRPSGQDILTKAIKSSPVQVWDAETGAARFTVGAQTIHAEYSADGRLILTAGDGVVQVWDAEDGALRQTLEVPGVLRAWLGPDARRVAVAGSGTADQAQPQRAGRRLRSPRRRMARSWRPGPDPLRNKPRRVRRLH
ncbi:MAG: hypothetical protein JXB47_09145 [Anaerolineae bacterium]|nr:hypothetical protein [Anaerolineae bacterium]